MRAVRRLEAAGVKHAIFFEPDLGGAPTAVATEPLRGKARALLRRFPLLKESAMKGSFSSDRDDSAPAPGEGAGSPIKPVFRSRWGFHPCDYETYQSLRRLRFLWFRTLRRLAAWHRWNRKRPHNRVLWRRVRVDGRPVGWERAAPWNEPAVPAFMVEQRWGERSLAHGWVDVLYRDAKRPSAEPREAWTVGQVAQIRALLAELEAWYRDKP